MKKLFGYGLLTALTLLLLCSCSVFSPVSVDSQNKYILNQLPHPDVKKSTRHVTLFVAQPDAETYYKTNQMAYRTRPYQIAYYAKNVWLSPPADMLQPLIIQSLQNTRHYHAVIEPGIDGRYDYVLNTQIQELLQDYSFSPCLLRLTVKAEIIRMANYKIIATKQFVIKIPIAQASPYGGVIAANQATAEMLRQLTRFCLNHT